MPKPVKKKPAAKAKRPSSDPNRRVHQMMAEHMAKAAEPTVTPPHGDPLADPVRAYMSKIGKKGGTVSGAKRMEMPEKQRREIAIKAAKARWKKP